MPVVELNTLQGNRRQRRARKERSEVVQESQPMDSPAPVEPGGPVAGLVAEHALLLDLFGRPPVVFHRSLVEIAGSVGAALWLSHALELSTERDDDGHATFRMSTEECAEAIGMSSAEQMQARKALHKAGLIRECWHGEHRAYRLDLARLAELSLRQSAVAWSLTAARNDTSPAKAVHATAA